MRVLSINNRMINSLNNINKNFSKTPNSYNENKRLKSDIVSFSAKNNDNDSLMQRDILVSCLKAAIEKKQYLSLYQISLKTGISVSSIVNLSRQYEEIDSLCEELQDIRRLNKRSRKSVQNPQQKTIDQIASEKILRDKVLRLIFDAKKEGKQLAFSTITKSTGAEKAKIIEIIEGYKKQKQEYQQQIQRLNVAANEALKAQDKKNDSLYSQYYEAPQVKRQTMPKPQTPLIVSDEQFKIIEALLNQSKESNTLVSIGDIAKASNLDEKIAYKAIKTRPDLLEIWQEVKATEKIGHNYSSETL